MTVTIYTDMGKASRLRVFNHILSVIVVAFCVYVITIPYLPVITFALHKSSINPDPYGFTKPNRTTSQPLPKDNRIIIPTAYINEPIKNGNSLRTISSGGVWFKNKWTKSPLDKGNTLLLGHRFTYEQPQGAFYRLDDVSVGDKFAVYWEGKEIVYKIVEKKVVSPEQISIEDNTTDRRVTIYTCTPLLSAKQRLVIVGIPEAYYYE